MRLSVMILSNPATSRAAGIALRLLEGAARQGHELDTAFFYHEGAYATVNPEPATQARWAQLSRASGLRCIVCRTARERAGLTTALIMPWIAGGLADWFAARDRCDRTLVLGRLPG